MGGDRGVLGSFGTLSPPLEFLPLEIPPNPLRKSRSTNPVPQIPVHRSQSLHSRSRFFVRTLAPDLGPPFLVCRPWFAGMRAPESSNFEIHLLFEPRSRRKRVFPRQPNRRNFLKTSAAAGAAVSVPYFCSQPKTLAQETRSKNDRIAMGVIGAGGMANGNVRSAKDWIDVVAIADVDQGSGRELQPTDERRQGSALRGLSRAIGS